MGTPDAGQPIQARTSAAAGRGPAISGARLRAPIIFDSGHLSRVKDFECGTQPWEVEVSDWIKAPRGAGGALDDMANLGTRVWLYETEADELVGYGSLGETFWRWPDPKK